MAFYKTHSDNPYSECMFSPTSNNILSLCGGSEFRLFKFQEDELRVTTTTISYKNYKPKVNFRNLILGHCLPYLAPPAQHRDCASVHGQGDPICK